MTIKRVLSLFDIHSPDNIPLYPILEFASDFKPHVLIYGGDAENFDSVSFYLEGKSRALDVGLLKQDYEILHTAVLDPFEQAVGNKCEKKYLKGNHEERADRACKMDPNGRGYWELENNIDGGCKLIGKEPIKNTPVYYSKKYNMEIYGLNVPYQACDNLYYIHGIYWNQHHAKKTVLNYQSNILYSHTHDVQTYSLPNPFKAKPHKAASCGCLCNKNPDYKKNAPNSWVHGFNFVYIDTKTQHFWDTQVYIINNRFIANGRMYK